MTQSQPVPLGIDLPGIDDILDRSHVVSLPMSVRFRGVDHREALLIEGPQGWGEFAPFIEYGPAESAQWLRAGLEAAFIGLPEPVRATVPVNGTIPAVPAGQVPEIMARYPGCTTFKIKVAEPGQSLEADIARVRAVREAVQETGQAPVLRVDANGAWSVEEAVAAARELMPLDYLEQPCATAEELVQVRQQLVRNGLFVRVAADESIRKVDDPFRVAELRAADVAVVKIAPLGGVHRVLDIAAQLRARHMDITVASALDTSVGIGMGLSAVAALPKIHDDDDIDVVPAAAGLATGSLFVENVTAPREIIDGEMAVDQLAPERARLESLAAPAKRCDWWFERVREAYPFLR